MHEEAAMNLISDDLAKLLAATGTAVAGICTDSLYHNGCSDQDLSLLGVLVDRGKPYPC